MVAIFEKEWRENTVAVDALIREADALADDPAELSFHRLDCHGSPSMSNKDDWGGTQAKITEKSSTFSVA